MLVQGVHFGVQNGYVWVQNLHIFDGTFTSASRTLICSFRTFIARSRASFDGPQHPFWVQNIHICDRTYVFRFRAFIFSNDDDDDAGDADDMMMMMVMTMIIAHAR